MSTRWGKILSWLQHNWISCRKEKVYSYVDQRIAWEISVPASFSTFCFSNTQSCFLAPEERFQSQSSNLHPNRSQGQDSGRSKQVKTDFEKWKILKREAILWADFSQPCDTVLFLTCTFSFRLLRPDQTWPSDTIGHGFVVAGFSACYSDKKSTSR